MKELIGTGVALITPFTKKGAVDTAALTRVVHFQIENGVNYLVVLGTTGESAVLSEDEKQLVIDTVVAAN
ncbi:MAG: 4-hydroxy-tetrahydrodipicolinate synthase, partial [Patiriisocius sp.]